MCTFRRVRDCGTAVGVVVWVTAHTTMERKCGKPALFESGFFLTLDSFQDTDFSNALLYPDSKSIIAKKLKSMYYKELNVPANLVSWNLSSN